MCDTLARAYVRKNACSRVVVQLDRGTGRMDKLEKEPMSVNGNFVTKTQMDLDYEVMI